MTDTIEDVALKVQHAVEQMPYRGFTELTADGSTERPTTLREFFENTWQGEHADEVFSAAANVATRAAITAYTKALIEGAGELERRLLAWADSDDAGRLPDPTSLKRQAAATIAAQKAKIERLTEREAQAKLDGVRAGIEASALLLERDDGFGEWWDAAQFVRSELDAEAITKGEG